MWTQQGGGEGGTDWEGSLDMYMPRSIKQTDAGKLRCGAELSLVPFDDPEGWEGEMQGGLKGRVYMYAYSWFTLLYSTNEYNVVKPLYAIKKRKNYKAKRRFSEWIEWIPELRVRVRLGLGYASSAKAKPKEDSLCCVSCICGQVITCGREDDDKACAVLAPEKML